MNWDWACMCDPPSHTSDSYTVVVPKCCQCSAGTVLFTNQGALIELFWWPCCESEDILTSFNWLALKRLISKHPNVKIKIVIAKTIRLQYLILLFSRFLVIWSQYLLSLKLLSLLSMFLPFPYLFLLIVQDILEIIYSSDLSLTLLDWARCPPSSSHSTLYMPFSLYRRKKCVKVVYSGLPCPPDYKFHKARALSFESLCPQCIAQCWQVTESQ